MRELLIKIRAILEGAGLKDAAAGQKELAKATQEATRAAEQQARTTTSQATPADKAAASAKEAVAAATKKSATTLDDLKRAGGPATQILQGLRQAANGGVDALFGLANAARGIIGIFTSLSGPFRILAAGIALAGGALIAFRDKIWSAKTSVEQLNKPLDEARERAKKLDEAKLDSFREQLKAIEDDSKRTIASLERLQRLSNELKSGEDAARIAEIEADPKLSETDRVKRVAEIRQAARERELQAPVEIARGAEQEAAKVLAEARQKEAAAAEEAAAALAALNRMQAQIDDITQRLAQANARLERADPTSLSVSGQQEFMDAKSAVFELLREARVIDEQRRTLGPSLEQRVESTSATAREAAAFLERAMGENADATGRRKEAEARAAGLISSSRQETGARLSSALRSAGQKDDENRARAAYETEGAAIGRQYRASTRGMVGATPEAAELLAGVDRAAAALEDGAEKGELDALLRAVNRLADAAEKAGSQTPFRNSVKALEARIQRMESQLARANDAR